MDNPAQFRVSYTFAETARVYQPEKIRFVNDVASEGYVGGSTRDGKIAERIANQEGIPAMGSRRKHKNGVTCIVDGIGVQESTEKIAVIYRYKDSKIYWVKDLDDWASELEDETEYKLTDSGLPEEKSRWKHWKGHTYNVEHIAVQSKTRKIAVIYRDESGACFFSWVRDMDDWKAKLEDGRERFTLVS